MAPVTLDRMNQGEHQLCAPNLPRVAPSLSPEAPTSLGFIVPVFVFIFLTLY